MRYLLAVLALSGCVTRERVRVEWRDAPPRVIEKHYLVPVLPMQMESEPEPEESEPPKMTA